MKVMVTLLSVAMLISCRNGSGSECPDGMRLWSDTPAFSSVIENQRELGGTSDVWDNLWEGDARPELPRVKNPSPKIKRWHSGEGADYLNEEVNAATGGRYPNPVRIWEGEPYPIGNGRISASVFNGSGRDRYAINESSYWSGGRNGGTINSMGDKSFNGEDGPDATDDEFGGDQPVADLIVDFRAPAREGSFVREIRLQDGEVRSEAVRGDVMYRSTSFVSYPDQVLAIQYRTDAPKGISARVTMALQRGSDVMRVEDGTLVFESSLANGMRCQARAVLSCDGGMIRPGEDFVDVEGAKTLSVIVAVETNYVMDYARGFKGEGPETRVCERLSAVSGMGFAEIEKRHVEDYRSMFDRVSLELPESPDSVKALPTPARLERYRQTQDDLGLERTIFNFGRYLMICTARPGGLPAGLQGIWNSMIHAPWGNDYHSNINFQMVNWLPEVANLPECHMPMIGYLWAMREPNRLATREYLQAIGEDAGDPDGWIVYTSHNPFGGHGWQVNLPGSAWYGLHIWEHFAFTRDMDYLRDTGYPMLRELSRFWMTHLKRLGKGAEGFVSQYKPVDVSQYPELADVEDGTLVVPLGWSPEHGPRGEDGVAHDQEIVTELFLNTIKASEALGVDKALADSLREVCSHMYFPRIGAKGNLMEWMIDRDPETEHRHTSHLFAVYPGSTITPLKTPDLAQAARQSLLFRRNTGESRTSWAWTWRSMLWMRLHDGDKGHEMIEGLITHNMLDNLFTSHRIPLQIDGNYGIAACMIEMLVQSHEGVISLLPAPCRKWPEGRIHGVKARGGIVVDMEWKDSEVVSYTLRSETPQTVTVQVNGELKEVRTEALVM